MLQLRDLYQELIVDHSKNPRNFGSIDDADRTAKGFNPLCGDKLKLFLKLNGDVIEDVRFEGSGCAISTASASIMCQTIKGQTLAQAEALFETFHFMLTGPKGPQQAREHLGKLAVFAGVSDYPARVKCATLAWHTLRSALSNSGDAVSTE